MSDLTERISSARTYLGMPEMRIFWFFIPFSIAILFINFVNWSFPVSVINSVLIIAVGIVLFFASMKVAGKNAEAVLEKSKLKSVVAGLEDGLVVYDQNLTVTYFNSAAESLFGFKADSILGRKISPQDAESPELRLFAQVMFPTLAPILVPRTKPGEYPQVADISFDNPEMELHVTTAPIAGEDGQLLGFMKLVRNRTRETSLIESKKEFITVASHQLRTPITEINWALQTLSEDPSLNDGNKDLVKNTLSSAKKLLVIVEDLLAISKMEEGRYGFSFEEANLVLFVEDLLKEALPQIERAGLKLYFEKPGEEFPSVNIDKSKISMVISNLIDNAIRYNVQGGQIVVGLKKASEGPFLEVSVKDTGIGIPAEEAEKLFTKFFRSSNAVKFHTDGSGLGLYIARNIVQSHGGKIWVESQLNRGSTFVFTIPTDPALIPTKEVAVE